MKGAWTIGACALLPALVAASLVAAVPDAAHDAGVARALGLAPSPWGSLDAALAGVFAWLPVGTRAARAAMGEAIAVGAAGAVLFTITRALLSACARLPTLGLAVAAVAASCATMSPAWQLEGSAPGGAALGAMLALVPLALLSRADEAPEATRAPPRWALAAFAITLSLGQDPAAGACCAAASLALLAAGPRARRSLASAWRGAKIPLLVAAATGLLPAAVAVARARAAGGSVPERVSAAWVGERAASASGAPWPLLEGQLGTVLTALAVGGAVLAILVPRARALAAALVVLAAMGLSSGWAGAALGPTRFGAPVLAGLAATCALAGAAMQAVVRVVAEARLPLARASAVMVVLLELVAPVDEADESLRLGAGRERGSGPMPDEPTAVWDDTAWGTLPPLSAVILTDPAIERRAAAARATGALRGDLTILPVLATGDAARALASDARLLPLWRDMTLDRAPSEEALSLLANGRPVVMAFEPEWGRVLGKHLVPSGLFDRFEPEPRGTSDRRKLLDAFTPVRERLARAVVRDRDLSSASALLLRRRLAGLGSSGDRDLVGAAVADLHAFAPDDPLAAQIVAKVVTAKGRP